MQPSFLLPSDFFCLRAPTEVSIKKSTSTFVFLLRGTNRKRYTIQIKENRAPLTTSQQENPSPNTTHPYVNPNPLSNSSLNPIKRLINCSTECVKYGVLGNRANKHFIVSVFSWLFVGVEWSAPQFSHRNGTLGHSCTKDSMYTEINTAILGW